MDLTQAILEIQKHLSLPDLKADDKGAFSIVIDDALRISLKPHKSGGFLVCGKVGDIPADEQTEELYLKKILRWNVVLLKKVEERLFLDTERKSIFIFRKFGDKNLTPLEFIEQFEGFLNNLEFWQHASEDKTPEMPPNPFMIRNWDV